MNNDILIYIIIIALVKLSLNLFNYVLKLAQITIGSDLVQIILGIIGLVGLMIGPILAYLAAKRKLPGEILLSDIQAVRDWSEARKGFEQEIADLHDALNEERERRRADRDAYLAQIDEILAEQELLKEQLANCRDCD